MTKLPKSLLRALERLDYHQIGVIEHLCLGLKAGVPGVDRELKALYRKHPALMASRFTARESKRYDDAIRMGATQDQALDLIVPLAQARRQRALARTKIPAAYAPATRVH